MNRKMYRLATIWIRKIDYYVYNLDEIDPNWALHPGFVTNKKGSVFAHHHVAKVYVIVPNPLEYS